MHGWASGRVAKQPIDFFGWCIVSIARINGALLAMEAMVCDAAAAVVVVDHEYDFACEQS